MIQPASPVPDLRNYLELLNRIPDVFGRAWDALAVYDLEGCLVACNAATRELLGEELTDSFAGTHPNAHMPVDVARQAARAFAQCLTTGGPVDAESAFCTSDGMLVPTRIRLVPARVDGTVVGVICFARDTRALHTAESQFIRAEDQFRSLFEHHPDALAIHDLDERYLRVNRATQVLTGYSARELIGATPELVVAGPWNEGDGVGILAAVRRGEPAEFEAVLRTKAGDHRDVVGRVVPLFERGAVVSYCSMVRDVTEERRRERESQREARRITALYRVAAAPAVSADERIISTLELARCELGAESAYFGRIADGRIEVTHVSGHAPSATPVTGAGTPVTIDGERYGEIGFANAGVPLRLHCGDREFAAAIAALVGTAVQQGAREKRLDTLAFYDPLTGLPNRSLLHDRLERALLAARRNRRSFAVHYIDIDHFKVINDTYGHHIGDGVLVAVAGWLQSTLRDSDTVARLGGDEFVVLQPEVESMRQAEDLAAKLAAIRERPLRIGDYEIVVRLSIGAAVFPSGRAHPVDMLRAADATLYDVKRHGRDGYKVGLVR